MPVIEASGYRLECDPANGGVVRSLSWDCLDLLRPSSEANGDPLGSAMFPLVPFSNRLSKDVPSKAGPLKLPRYLRESEFAIHGFGWQKQWSIQEHDAASNVLVIEDRLSPWPSAYRAEQRFALSDQGLEASITLENIGDAPMPAGLGFHPYFVKADCEAAMLSAAKWAQDERGLPDHEMPAEWRDGEALTMAEMRVDHSYSGWDGIARLTYSQSALELTMQCDEVLRELVIYSPDDDYFCIEPVSHVTNAMFAKTSNARRGWRELQPGERMMGSFQLRANRL